MSKLSLHLTTHMTIDEIEPYFEEIEYCFQKYVDRFPEHETVESMWNDIKTGKRDLWIVKDEAGKVILTPITEILKMPTGRKILVLAEVGGERIQEALPLLHEIEEWAVKEHNVEEAQFPGRTGYRKLLGQYGYKEQIVTFTKELKSE